MADGQKQTGYNMVLSVGGSPLAVARDVNLTLSATTIDATTRGGNGWREKCQGLKEWGVTADSVWIPDDAAYVLVRDAFKNGTPIAVILTDIDLNTDTGSAYVVDLSRPEPLDDVVSVAIEFAGNGELVYAAHA
jgi:predicted secreted protein